MLKELRKGYLEVELPQKVREAIKKVVKEMKLKKEQIEKLENEVKKEYFKSVFEPGEAVGIITAQSISEPATQMTMRTYHVAGAVGIKVTYGLPRLIEIFDAKKEPEAPAMTIYLKRSYNNPKTARKFAEKIIERKLVHFLKKASINLSEGSVEIEVIDKRKASLIVKKIKEKMKLKVRSKGSTIIVMAEEFDVKELQKLRRKLLELTISGIEGIENALVRKEGRDWIIETAGSNLEEIMKLKEVDARRVLTNDIHEIARVLGIEAARNLIVYEAVKTMQQQALDVDIRHIMLVADIMTVTGNVKPIGRYGVAGAKASVLARAAFEETIKHLVRASLRNEVDDFKGIFENVMIGQVIPSGTGMFDLIAVFEEEEREK